MPYQISPNGLSNPSLTVGQVLHHLARLVTEKMDRNAFFQILAKSFVFYFTTTVSASISMTPSGNF